MAIADKRIVELPTASSIDLTTDWLAVDSDTDGTRKCKPLQIGAKYSLEQDETDSHVLHFTGTDGTDVSITTADTKYSITQSGHSFTFTGTDGTSVTITLPSDSVDKTQAQYDALPSSKNSDNTNYFITDGDTQIASALWAKVGREAIDPDLDTQSCSKAINTLYAMIQELQ